MLQGMKILAVDDDALSLEMLASILSDRGAVCCLARDGREAMDIAEVSPDIDIMILDLQMPVMSGFDVLRQCKGNPYLNDLPVVVVAADHAEKLASLKLGADDFLAKPYNHEELELRIVKLVDARRLAQAARKAKQEFLSIASHELRTPMHQIKGMAELLEDSLTPEEQQELIGQLKQSARNLTHIIRDILYYTQLDQGAARSSVDAFSLHATIYEALDSLEESAARKGLRLKRHIPGQLSDYLNGHSYYIYRVLTILVENAIKFSRGGDIDITMCEYPFGSNESRFSCTVANHGQVIPAGFRERVFEPFIQADASRSRAEGGLGLGLAIARRLVELMGGTISLAECDDEGHNSFTFTFHCGLRRPEAEPQPAGSEVLDRTISPGIM